LALLAGLFLTVACNGFWLLDWIDYWWLRVPLQSSGALLPHRTLHTLWNAPLWGAPTDRILVVLLLVAGTVGAAIYDQRGRRASARLFGLGAAGLLSLAVGGVLWEPLGRLGAIRLLPAGLLFAVPLALQGLGETFHAIASWTGRAWPGITIAAGLVV